MKVLIDISEKMFKATQTYYSDNTTRLSIKSCIEKIANGTPIPDNATNGDMIMAMFPTMEIEECNKDINGNPNLYRIYGLSGVAEFGREFWNTPYKGVEE